MPNLQNIKNIAEAKGISIRNLAKIANMTEQGLHNAIKNNEIKFSVLEKIAIELGVDIHEFSEVKKIGSGIAITGNRNFVGNNNTINAQEKEIKHLKEIIRQKDIIIGEKDKQIELYERLHPSK